MDFEIEFLPVGDASKAGDAIVARYGSDGQYAVTVIDGGTQDSGEALVAHIKSQYGERTIVDNVISTHPDNDHASGLRRVLSELPVRTLWLHGLWRHTQDILRFFSDKRLTPGTLREKIQAEYPIVAELMDLAKAQDTPVYEPFQGSQIGPFTVLSPNRHCYDRLVPQFRRTPEADRNVLESEDWYLHMPKQAAGVMLSEKAAHWVPEDWNRELLKGGAVVAAENETSVVLWGSFGDSRVLLTADAGVYALRWACEFAQSKGIDVQTAGLVQVPHHGSRRNLSPQILDRLLGTKVPPGSAERRCGIVSAPENDETHPRKMVMNAFLRRGTPVRKTQGVKVRYHRGMPERRDEREAQPFGFFSRVEAYD